MAIPFSCFLPPASCLLPLVGPGRLPLGSVVASVPRIVPGLSFMLGNDDAIPAADSPPSSFLYENRAFTTSFALLATISHTCGIIAGILVSSVNRERVFALWASVLWLLESDAARFVQGVGLIFFKVLILPTCGLFIFLLCVSLDLEEVRCYPLS